MEEDAYVLIMALTLLQMSTAPDVEARCPTSPTCACPVLPWVLEPHCCRWAMASFQHPCPDTLVASWEDGEGSYRDIYDFIKELGTKNLQRPVN